MEWIIRTRGIAGAISEIPFIGLLKTPLKTRQSYRKAVIEGMGVYEYTDPRAKEEMVALVQEINDIIAQLNA